MSYFFFQAENGIRDLVRARGLGDVYKRQEDYSIRLSSSFDEVFQGMIASFARDLTAKLEAQARARLEQDVREPLDSLKTRAGSLDAINEELKERIALAEALLKDSIFSVYYTHLTLPTNYPV